MRACLCAYVCGKEKEGKGVTVHVCIHADIDAEWFICVCGWWSVVGVRLKVKHNSHGKLIGHIFWAISRGHNPRNGIWNDDPVSLVIL